MLVQTAVYLNKFQYVFLVWEFNTAYVFYIVQYFDAA